MQSYGIQPGPQLMTDQPDLVWTLLASLLIGNTLLLVLNLPLAPLWAKLLRIPRPYLYAGILFFASLGAYTANLEAFDLVPAAGVRPARPGDAPVRAAGAAADPRRHPRPADGDQAARGADHLRRRRVRARGTSRWRSSVYVIIALLIVVPGRAAHRIRPDVDHAMATGEPPTIDEPNRTVDR